MSIFSKTKRNIKKFYSFLSTYLLVVSRKERVTFFDIALNFRENRLWNSSRWFSLSWVFLCATGRIVTNFEVDFLENEAQYQKILFLFVDLFTCYKSKRKSNFFPHRASFSKKSTLKFIKVILRFSYAQLDATSRISKSIFSKMKRNIKNLYSFLSTYLLVTSRKERVTFFYIALHLRENRLRNSWRCVQSRTGKSQAILA